MHPSGDRSLDELLAAAAPVTDRDLDRPEVRAAARALIEELPMPDDPTAPKQAGDRPPLAIRPARDPEAGPADDLVVSLPAGADRPRRRGRVAVAAAVVAVALAVGSAAFLGGGDGGAPAGDVDPAAGPAAATQQGDQPETACEWAWWWLDADLRGDQEGRDQATAGLAELLAERQAEIAAETGDPASAPEAREAEMYLAAMSAGDRLWIEARHSMMCRS